MATRVWDMKLLVWLGIKMADPSRDVYVMVGDGSYLMLAQEIITSIQEGYKLIIVSCEQRGA